MISQHNRILLDSADKLAQDVGALAIISFIPIEERVALTTPIINAMDIHSELIYEKSIDALLDYCNHHIYDAAVQYRIITKTDSGKVVAVFPNAILIYHIDDTKKEFSLEEYHDIANADVINSVITLAMEIAREGREGNAIGTAFIIGDIEELKHWSHQGVLNPYAGHPKEVRDITKRENWESVKEFSQLDGVFLIDGKGIIEASGKSRSL